MAASFFDASEDCVKLISLDGDLLAMNVNGISLLEIGDFDPYRGRPWVSLWPDTARQMIEDAIKTARGGRGTRFSADCPTAAGTLKAWEVTVWPVLDEAGRPVNLISISRDITERRRLDEERVLFAQELSHRIKNMFAVVDGVIMLSSRAVPQAKSFANALRDRLSGLGRAMAYVAPPGLGHGAGEAEGRTLQGLLHVLLQPYGATEGAEQRVFVSGDDTGIGARSTTTLALIFNELATNALKYGALSSGEGRVDLAIAAAAGEIEMTWRERSPKFQTPPDGPAIRRMGFGSTLLENAVVRQLAGQFDRQWAPDGLTVMMRCQRSRFAM